MFKKYALFFVVLVLTVISIYNFIFYYKNGLGLSYNDARSHLDIGRRVVEGLKPGIAQIGSVWLPLPHLLMVPTIGNDFMWHSGLSGALESMISFVITGALIYKILEKLGAKMLARLIGVAVFVLNLNILYLQSTAMTELLLLATLTAGVYYFICFYQHEKILDLIKSAFYIMLSSLIRYEGWFLIGFAGIVLALTILKKKGYKVAEGTLVLFTTLAGVGIVLWILWNQLIFKDALYFAIGPFSAHAQQADLAKAGNLPTKGNILLSIKIYLYSLIYSTGAFTSFLGLIGAIVLWFDKKIKPVVRVASLTLMAPFIFNVLALYFGFSVLSIQGISGNTWFNVRYGVMMMPSIAVFVGYLVHRAKSLRWVIIGLFLFTTFFMFVNYDAVTVDDARVGSSQKNVSEVSGWLKDNASNKSGFILISAASHDAIIFSSGLPMARFIHEGTGAYWESATTAPDRWARWIVMRTYDESDLTYKALSKTKALDKYNLVAKYPFADVYEIKPEYLKFLNRDPIFGKQK
ncbi:hypothetical protein HYS03_00780 [Candidatus Woesebacteria bacterium]|nr:hypothetical protein [Candidatus Woesebacteria bacterium]QQG47197.1 MAG: hypothetical protein HY044_03595 [Candidatus Woesebacteria bacterium]